jgi:hypothetical protein
MNYLRKNLLVAMLACLMLGAALMATALAVQTHMYAAKGNLQSALTELNTAVADKAGHRENAINLVKQAITQVNLGIQAGAK